MKFGKITSKKAGSKAVMVGGAVAGAMISDAVVSALPIQNPLYSKLAVMLAAGTALIAFEGKSTAGEAVAGVLTGMAIQQATATSKEGLSSVLPASVKENTLVQAALGNNTTQAALQMPKLGAPIKAFNPGQFQLGNPQQTEELSISAGSLLG